MTVEKISNLHISRENVIKELRKKPQTFYELLGEFGISRNLNTEGSYCKDYLRLLDIVSILETAIISRGGVIKKPPIISCAKKINECAHVLYLTEDEKKLMELGKVRTVSDNSRAAFDEYWISLEQAKKLEEIKKYDRYLY